MNTILKEAEINGVKIILFIGLGYHRRWGTTQLFKYDTAWCGINENKIVHSKRPRLTYTMVQRKFSKMAKMAKITKFETT